MLEARWAQRYADRMAAAASSSDDTVSPATESAAARMPASQGDTDGADVDTEPDTPITAPVATEQQHGSTGSDYDDVTL